MIFSGHTFTLKIMYKPHYENTLDIDLSIQVFCRICTWLHFPVKFLQRRSSPLWMQHFDRRFHVVVQAWQSFYNGSWPATVAKGAKGA
jgi:hypothetical protein